MDEEAEEVYHGEHGGHGEGTGHVVAGVVIYSSRAVASCDPALCTIAW